MDLRRRPQRGGFTLMEMIVVIGIIVTLLGLLIPAVGMVRKMAAKAKVEALIQNTESATETYRTLNGSYPERYDLNGNGTDEVVSSTAAGADNNRILVNCLASVDAELFSVNSQRLAQVDQGLANPLQNAVVIDIWQQPLYYRPYSAYPWDPAVTTPVIDSDTPPNPDGFQLWSTGYDIQQDFGEGDDITNWD